MRQKRWREQQLKTGTSGEAESKLGAAHVVTNESGRYDRNKGAGASALDSEARGGGTLGLNRELHGKLAGPGWFHYWL